MATLLKTVDYVKFTGERHSWLSKGEIVKVTGLNGFHAYYTNDRGSSSNVKIEEVEKVGEEDALAFEIRLAENRLAQAEKMKVAARQRVRDARQALKVLEMKKTSVCPTCKRPLD